MFVNLVKGHFGLICNLPAGRHARGLHRQVGGYSAPGVKARVGDWFVFRVADGRFAAARIGAVASRGNSYTGWFFGPFDAPPAVSSLHELTPADAVWPAHFYSLEGAGGPWERVIEGGPDAE